MDPPIARIFPRPVIIGHLSEKLEVDESTARALLASLEDKGFVLQDAVTLVLLAKARVDEQVSGGSVSRDTRAAAMGTTVARMIELVDQGAGWVGLQVDLGPEVQLSAAMSEASLVISPPSKVVARRSVAPRRSFSSSGASRAAKAKAPGQSAGYPPDEIYKNLAHELGVDAETAKRDETTLEREFPLREAILLLVLANARAGQLIGQGKFTAAQRDEAVQASLPYFVAQAKGRVGWGDLAKQVGLDGSDLNARVLAITGQK